MLKYRIYTIIVFLNKFFQTETLDLESGLKFCNSKKRNADSEFYDIGI